METSSIEIQESDLENLDCGGFGTVYLIKNHKPPTVLKDLHEKHNDSQGISEKERMVLENSHHDHIVKYYGIGRFYRKARNAFRFGILMEYCEKGSLKDWLYESTLIYEMCTVVWWSQQMMSALKYLQEMQMVHRDIKPANILVTKDFALKLGDFGSTRLNHQTAAGSTFIETEKYMSPELWSNTSAANRTISRRCDVYSLGLVMWEMIERREISYQKIKDAYFANDGPRGLFDFEPLIRGHEMREIIERCTVFDYNSRPYASEMLQEILTIYGRIGGLAAIPRIDNNETRVLKPMGMLSINRVRMLRKHLDAVRNCSWSPKEDVLATGSWDNTARIWNLQECEDMTNPDSKYENGFVFEKHFSSVYALDWHPNGDRIATGDFGGVVRIWDTMSGELHSTLKRHKGWINTLRWNPSGDLLLSGDEDGSTIVWEQPIKTLFSFFLPFRPPKYQKKQEFKFHSDDVWDVDWISDDTFGSCSEDKTIKVCRVGSDRPIRTYEGHTLRVTSVRYDSFSKRLASGSDDKSIKIWSLSEDEPVHTFTQHLDVVNKVRWSPQGSILASASFDRTVRIWDGNQGKEVAVLNGHAEPVESVAFSPNGQLIASGSRNHDDQAGSVFIWDVNTHQAVTSWKTNNGDGIWDVAFNRTGEKLAACTQSGAIVIMDLRFLKRGHGDSILPLHRMDTST